jgi:DNA polymerase-3 subunit delta'
MREVVGNERAQRTLAQVHTSGQVRHAYLLTGPEGIGKTTLAVEFARLLLCERTVAAAGEPCGECSSCRRIAHGNHPDVTLLDTQEGKRFLGVDAVREDVVRLANLTPSSGKWRVFILPGAERMTPNTVTALLKTLEEPPAGVVLLLTSAEPENLLPTLVSRCQNVPLHQLTAAQIAAALRDRWHVESTEADELAALANGRLGWAVRAHERPELHEARRQQLETIMALCTSARDERLRRVAELSGDPETARRALELWTLWWRDVILAANDATHLASVGSAREMALQQGRTLGAERAHAFLRALIDARAALDANANPRLTLEVLMLDLPFVPGASVRR